MDQHISMALGVILGAITAFLLVLLAAKIRNTYSTHKREIQALCEVAILFLPAIPAYLWIWPNQPGKFIDAFQAGTYFYVLVGTLVIGLRHFTWDEMGVNWNGFAVGLVYGAVLIAGRSLVIISVDWNTSRPSPNIGTILFDLLYCILIGITEELLFRGVVYRSLLNWQGTRWAIWGSSIGFMLWHVFGQGPLAGTAMVFYGLVFALMRWRMGGISSLVVTHALVDFFGFQMLPDIDVTNLGRPEVPHPIWMLAGLILIMVVPLVLWIGPWKPSKTERKII